MDAVAEWKEGLSFKGETGAETVNMSSEDGASPMGLFLTSLAGCTAMDVISILQKKRQDVKAFRVNVHGDRAADHPKVYTHIEIEYVVEGRGIDPAAVDRAVELSETKYCSVMAMVRKAVPMERKITIHQV